MSPAPLVAFVCPTHGWLLDTFPTAVVYCSRCDDAPIGPAGVDGKAHLRSYLERRRARTAMRGLRNKAA